MESPHKKALANRGCEELFAWPSVGILANIKTELRNGKRIGASGSEMKDELIRKGFNPLNVIPWWDLVEHLGFAIVEFSKDWAGFTDAMAFEKNFVSDNCGKEDYDDQESRGDKMFGWVARESDLKNMNIVGTHLGQQREPKLFSGKEAKEKSKEKRIVPTLKGTLEEKRLCLREMELNATLDEQDKMLRSQNEEIRKLQQSDHDYFKMTILKHEKFLEELAKEEAALMLREKELQQRGHNINERERNILIEKKKMLEQRKLHEKIVELEKQIDSKAALASQIEHYRGALEVLKQMRADKDLELKKNIEHSKEKLEETVEQLEAFHGLNQTLIVKERKSNDELQDARKEMISELGAGKRPPRASIGVKRMGDLDIRPFVKASKSKGSTEECQAKAVEQCQLWDSYLRDPMWHPFKIFTDKHGKSMEIIIEDDEKLSGLKSELGEEVYGAVISALKEMNEHNPSGRYPVPEIWNFREKRRAPLSEAVEYMLKQWRASKIKNN